MAKAPEHAKEFFYGQRGKRLDAELHDQIISGGDDDVAKEVSRKVMQRLGIPHDKIERLLKKTLKPPG